MEGDSISTRSQGRPRSCETPCHSVWSNDKPPSAYEAGSAPCHSGRQAPPQRVAVRLSAPFTPGRRIAKHNHKISCVSVQGAGFEPAMFTHRVPNLQSGAFNHSATPASPLPRQGSNLESSDPESDVLPITPRSRNVTHRTKGDNQVTRDGIEPPTRGSSGRRSTH